MRFAPVGLVGLVGLVVLAAVEGCSRPSAGVTDASPPPASASPVASEAISPVAAPSAPRADVAGIASSGLEARRSIVTHIEADPILSANAEALRKQHGGAIPASFAVQATDLGADHRRAIIAGSARKDGTLENPMLFVVDERGTLLWSKERPVAGIKAPIGPLAISAGPHGRFALAACDPPTSTVAFRLWDADGSPFADFQVLEIKGCDALSLLYWPQRGWVIAVTSGPETRGQLVSDSGGRTWGAGRVLGARFRTIAPVSLASDGRAGFFLVHYSQTPGADRDVDHAIAYRYDERAEPLWPMPVDLGAVRRVAPGQERITLTRSSDRNVLTAALIGGITIEIRSNGETRRVP